MTFSEAAMIMMSGGSKVIQALSVTEYGTYSIDAPDGVDGYNPVNIQLPDRYDEGYQDGYSKGHDDGYSEGYADGESAVKAKIQSKTITENGIYYAADDGVDGFDPVNVQVPDKYQDGYSDGFEFAANAFNGIVDDSKLYTVVMDLSVPVSGYTGLNFIYVRLFKTDDLNTELSHNNIWPTNMFNCYYAKITKLWWGSSNTLHYQLRSYNSDKTVEYRPEGNTIGTPIAWFSCNNANTNVIVKY